MQLYLPIYSLILTLTLFFKSFNSKLNCTKLQFINSLSHSGKIRVITLLTHTVIGYFNK